MLSLKIWIIAGITTFAFTYFLNINLNPIQIIALDLINYFYLNLIIFEIPKLKKYFFKGEDPKKQN